MRVIHVLDHSVPWRTSYAARTLAMLAELRALGWETYQITGPKQGAGTAREEDVDGWTFHRCPPPGGILEGVPVLGEIELMGEITYRIEQVARRVHPHIVHAHSPVLNALPALRVARRVNIPMVYEVRSLWEDAAVAQGRQRERGLRYHITRAMESWTLRRADAVVTICEGLRGDLLARGIPAEKLHLIAHAAEVSASVGPDEGLKRELGLEDAFVLCFIGPLYEHEGGDILVRALPLLRQGDKRVRVLVMGVGPQQGFLRQLAQELGVSEELVFAGEVAERDLGRYRELADALVFPRRSTRFTELVTPVQVLEAMARGNFVIASDVGGHRELVRHGETGILFKKGEAGALAAAVLEAMRQPERRAQIAASARRYVETERNWRANAKAYEALYAHLTQRAPA